jgi:PAS domain S-box-containing protein
MQLIKSMIQKTKQYLTQLEQTRQALQASEARFRNVIEKNADGIIIVDQDGIVRFVNQAAETLLCRSADDLMGEIFGFPLVANDTTELDIVCPRGKETVAEMRVVESEWEGEFVYLASLRDITAHKQAENALRVSEERYRMLFNSGDDAVFVYGIADGLPTKFIEVNDIACRRLDYTREELLSLTSLDIEADSDPSDNSKLMEEFLAKKQIMFERQHVRKDGQQIPVEINAHLFDLNGQPTVLAVARDITERKLSELQIKAALREKELLLQEIHHRVKNNLSIVSSLLSVQADLIEDEQARAAFQESQNRIHSIARIHQHLYRSVDLAGIDMAEYIHNLVEFLQMSYGAYEVSTTVNVADDLTLDIQAAIPCGLIVNELVSNIFKYAFPPEPDGQNGTGEKGDRKFWVELFDSDEAELVMVVRDNGQGLSPDFDWRNAPSLGLQLVNLLVRQSEGRIEVALASGTTFKIVFPPSYRKGKRSHKAERVTERGK